MEYAIQTENLVKRYNNAFTALDGVSLRIEKGDTVGYVGPNGAGKTTTIKILTNLIKPTSGHAYIDGLDVNRMQKEALRNVGALIEVPGVYEYLTPHEMLAYFGKVYKMNSTETDQRIKEVLDLVKLLDWEHKKIGSFSTGMQRRLVVAKAILHRPEILLLDEPVLGLDPEGIRDIRELIRQLHSEGMTVLLSSHLLGEVAETCNRVIFLDKGKVIASDSVDNIGSKTEYRIINVRFLRPLSAEQTDKLRSIESTSTVEIEGDTARIHFDGRPDTSYRILQELVSSGFEVVSYSPESMGLEDYYVSLMDTERGTN